jgi:hypothetical protein
MLGISFWMQKPELGIVKPEPASLPLHRAVMKFRVQGGMKLELGVSKVEPNIKIEPRCQGRAIV